MGFTHLRDLQIEIKKNQRVLKIPNILGKWTLQFGCKCCKYVDSKSLEIFMLNYFFKIYSILFDFFLMGLTHLRDLQIKIKKKSKSPENQIF